MVSWNAERSGIVTGHLDGPAGGDQRHGWVVRLSRMREQRRSGGASHLAGKSGAGSATGCSRFPSCPARPMLAWKRRRFARPKWFIWACVALAVVSVAIVATGAFRFVARQYDSAQQRSINQLLESSRANEADGRLDQALIDLDTAIEMARKAGPSYLARIDDWEKKRPDLARREAQTVVDRLARCRPVVFPAGQLADLDRPRRERPRSLAACRPRFNSSFWPP